MSKIERSLASDYVPSWTIVDAIRELFQNALDQEVQCPDNKASWSYENGTFKICNKQSMLTAKTLLLGTSSKDNDNRTIGQFGEGYMIATLVLLRNAKQVTIYNYGLREVWRPRFVKSRRFGTDILTFFIDKEYPWTKVPDNDLTIEVTGLTDEEWFEQVVPANLHLQSDVKIEASNEYGEALSAAKHAGLVFVNGLYVCKYDPNNPTPDWEPKIWFKCDPLKNDSCKKTMCRLNMMFSPEESACERTSKPECSVDGKVLWPDKEFFKEMKRTRDTTSHVCKHCPMDPAECKTYDKRPCDTTETYTDFIQEELGRYGENQHNCHQS